MTVVGSISETNYTGLGMHQSLSSIDLESPGVVTFDTSVVPDVLGLKAFYGDDEPLWVLPGMAENIIRILVPDDRAEPRGFHDILCDLGRLWPCSCRSVRLTWSRSVGSVGAGLVASCQAHVLIVRGSSSPA